MKKAFFILVLILLIFAHPCSFGAKKTKTKISEKQKIEFTTKDKYILVGDLYLANPKTQKPLVVLVHSYGLSAKFWEPIPEKLRQKGYNVLTMDLRGHARSIYNDKMKIKSRFGFKDEQWQKLPDDIVQSINYVKSNYTYINCNEIYMAGADVGAGAVILGGLNLSKQPSKMVLISPMLNFKGLYIPIKIANYKNTKFFVLLSKADKILFNFHSSVKPQIKTYPSGGQGNMLIRANKEAVDDIINFFIY